MVVVIYTLPQFKIHLTVDWVDVKGSKGRRPDSRRGRASAVIEGEW